MRPGPNVLLVILNHAVLDRVSENALECVCQQVAVGDGVGFLGGVIDFIFLLESIDFLVEPCYIFIESFFRYVPSQLEAG